MNTLICAGGSGARVLEAVLHFCAVGLGPSELRTLVIDPDSGNGNANGTKLLVEKYWECHKEFASKPDCPSFFSTRLDLLETEGGTPGLKIWSPAPAGETLAHILNYNGLLSGRPSQDVKSTPQDVARLLFTSEELATNLDKGFMAHPAIGAAALALLPLYAGSSPWKQLVDRIKVDISKSPGSRVFLAGSVFGGTGASAFHPVARFLRSIPDQVEGRLKIGVGALVPYFQFQASTQTRKAQEPEMGAKSERFPLATRSALAFYDYLRKEKDWPFDSVYWLGNDSLKEVPYCWGGSGQKNPAHFVELLAALACLDFFTTADKTSQACYYCGPREHDETEVKARNVLEWRDISVARRDEVQRRLLQFALVGAMHLGFGAALARHPELERRPHYVPWYKERIVSKNLRLTTHEFDKGSKLLAEFFEGYHFPWLSQLHDAGSTPVRLFNHSAVLGSPAVEEKLKRLANLLYPDDRGRTSLDAVDWFFSDMVEVAQQASGQDALTTYLSLLECAAARFMIREYAGDKGVIYA